LTAGLEGSEKSRRLGPRALAAHGACEVGGERTPLREGELCAVRGVTGCEVADPLHQGDVSERGPPEAERHRGQLRDVER
ncbi:hypothetical protein ABTM86_20070, partial [Acinetobacter baumannii]